MIPTSESLCFPTDTLANPVCVGERDNHVQLLPLL